MKRLHKAMTRIVGVLLMALMMVPSGLKAETTEMLQTSKITGVVTDDFGEPIIGVTVRVKNAQNGAVTDVNGRYSVNAPKNVNQEYYDYKKLINQYYQKIEFSHSFEEIFE